MERKTPNVPIDGRPQFSPSVVATVNALMGRMPLADVETVTPGGSYILKNTWPTPKANGYSATPISSKEGQRDPQSSNFTRPEKVQAR